MSGTSADGVDAVLARFDGQPYKPIWALLNHVSLPYPQSLRKRVLDAGQGSKINSSEWLELAESITEVQAEAALACDPHLKSEIVGCHGQTICHRPPRKTNRGASLQLLQAPLLAKLLARPVIYDFRSKDLANGGEGAPLTPLADEALMGRFGGWRAVLNLGGIANITLIPPNKGPERLANVLGWDAGPANSLIDLAVHKLTNGALEFDRDGLIAKSGTPHLPSIENWLKEPFFQRSPPKSTGRETFGLLDLERRFAQMPLLSRENLIATITCFTSSIVVQDLNNIFRTDLIRPVELLVSGGGSRNQAILKDLRMKCKGIRVLTTEEYGIPVQAREALAFALFSWWHTLNYPCPTYSLTGVNRPLVMGIRVNPN